MAFTRQEWFDRFTAALASVISALTNGGAAAQASTLTPADGWVVTLRAELVGEGDLKVELDGAAAEDLTRRVMQSEVVPSPDEVVDTLKELCAQAAGSMVLEAPLVGVKLGVTAVHRAKDGEAPAAAHRAQISMTEAAPLPLLLWGDIALSAPAPAAGAAATAARPPAPAAPVTPKLDVILDIDLPLTVRFGRTELPLRVIAGFGPGSVIDFGRSPDDPVEVLVGNQIVARGEVVIVGGNYGVRITDVTSAADRVRSVEGQLS